MIDTGYRPPERAALRCGCFPYEFIGKVSFHILSLSRSFIRRGGDGMYVTWELLFTFCIVIMDLVALVILIFQNNKKK